MVLRQLKHCATKHNREKSRAVVNEDMIRWKQPVTKHVSTYYHHKLTAGYTVLVLRVCRYCDTNVLGQRVKNMPNFSQQHVQGVAWSLMIGNFTALTHNLITLSTNLHYYLCQVGYIIVVVCLLATLRKNCWMDLHGIFRVGWSLTSLFSKEFSGKVGNGPMNKRLNFGGDPDNRSRSRHR